MSHFAQINEKNVVVAVIVADQDFINSGAVGDPSAWIQTSYNTRQGIHYGPDGLPDNGPALRRNFAGIGSIYDAVKDIFIPPSPYPSWKLDENSDWQAPIPYPDDGNNYYWDEDNQNWIIIPSIPD